MSFLGGIGKFIGNVAKGVGKVVKTALPLVKFGAGFIPGVGGVVSKVLALGAVKKGLHLEQTIKKQGSAFRGIMPGGASIAPPAPVLRASTAGITPLVAVKHARTVHKVASYGRATPARRKARKAKPAKRAAAKRRTGRKLKFGSPAWRKKYLKKKR